MTIQSRIRAAQAAELDRLQAAGLVAVESLVRERVLLGGSSMMAVLVDDEEDVQGQVIGLAGTIEVPDSMLIGGR